MKKPPTPGPWNISPIGPLAKPAGYFPEYIESHGEIICRVLSNWHANAALISAAPEMLELLTTVEDVVYSNNINKQQRFIEAVNKVIKKAKDEK